MTQTSHGAPPTADVGRGWPPEVTARGPFGPPSKIGAGEATRAVTEDVKVLGKALVDLGKAELQDGMKAKATGGGLFAAAGMLAGIAFLGLLLMAGFLLAEVAGLPGWASALIVSVVLLLIAAILAFAGKKKLQTEISLETTKHHVEEAIEWAKEHVTIR